MKFKVGDNVTFTPEDPNTFPFKGTTWWITGPGDKEGEWCIESDPFIEDDEAFSEVWIAIESELSLI